MLNLRLMRWNFLWGLESANPWWAREGSRVAIALKELKNEVLVLFELSFGVSVPLLRCKGWLEFLFLFVPDGFKT